MGKMDTEVSGKFQTDLETYLVIQIGNVVYSKKLDVKVSMLDIGLLILECLREKCEEFETGGMQGDEYTAEFVADVEFGLITVGIFKY